MYIYILYIQCIIFACRLDEKFAWKLSWNITNKHIITILYNSRIRVFILLCFPFIIIYLYTYCFRKRPRERDRVTERQRRREKRLLRPHSTHTHTRRKSIGQIFLRRYVYYGVHICYPRGPYYDKYQIEWRERCLFPYNCLPTPLHQDIGRFQ